MFDMQLKSSQVISLPQLAHFPYTGSNEHHGLLCLYVVQEW